MRKQEYIDKITQILDQAAGDKALTLQDYADLCGEISDDARSRFDAAESDIEGKEE